MATASAPASKKTADPLEVALALADGEMPVAELLKKVTEHTLNIAWTGGYVEFGSRDYTVTGNPHDSQFRLASQLHLEKGESWTGEKKPHQCSLKEILARGTKLPEVGAYKFNRAGEEGYKPSNPDESPLADITREEAQTKVYLKARLTDKGHQLLITE